jgi:hypothetical protein
MRVIRVLSLLLPSLAMAARPLSGQQAAPVDSGARLRIRAPAIAHTRLTGTLVSWQRETITLRNDADHALVTIPTATVVEIDRSTGRRSNVLRGAGIGTAVGVAFGALAGLTMAHKGDDIVPAEAAAIMGVVIGGVGLVFGAIGGAASPGDWWEPVSTRVSVAVTRAGGTRPGVGLSVTF